MPGVENGRNGREKTHDDDPYLIVGDGIHCAFERPIFMRRALEKDIRIGLMSVNSFWYNVLLTGRSLRISTAVFSKMLV